MTMRPPHCGQRSRRDTSTLPAPLQQDLRPSRGLGSRRSELLSFYRRHIDAALGDLAPPRPAWQPCMRCACRRAHRRRAATTTAQATRCPSRPARPRSSRARRCSISSRASCGASPCARVMRAIRECGYHPLRRTSRGSQSGARGRKSLGGGAPEDGR